MVGQLEVINIMRHSKIWEYENDDSYDPDYMDEVFTPAPEKNPAYKKPQRPKTSFVEEWSTKFHKIALAMYSTNSHKSSFEVLGQMS